MPHTISNSPGTARLKVLIDDRCVYVGPFASLASARRMAQDLAADSTVRSVAVQHRNKGVWARLAAFVLLAVALGGCATATPGTASIRVQGAGLTQEQQGEPNCWRLSSCVCARSGSKLESRRVRRHGWRSRETRKVPARPGILNSGSSSSHAGC